MAGLYYADMLDVLEAAGCRTAENGTTDGWQSRARSSGGFPAPPLAVFWHHTASDTTPANDLSWMIDGSDDAPIGNLLLDRTGTFWPIAAGASNCAGKGGPATFTRGTIPADGGNTRGWQLEVANDGLGEPWPVAQVDAYFAGSNALNAHVGNDPGDVITHAGWTDRKVDPATAAAVAGPWSPRSTSSAGTWNLDDVRAECRRRAQHEPEEPVTDQDVERIAWAVWSLALGGVSASNHLQAAAGSSADGPARTVNFPVPLGAGTADLWSVIVDTYQRVVALEQARVT